MSNLSNILTIAGNATATAPGIILLTRDLGGTFDAPLVTGLNGIPLSGIPTAGQVLTFDGTNWKPVTPAGQSSTAKRVTSATYASSLTPNAATTDIYRVILTGNATLANPAGTPVDGQQLQVHFIQDGNGGRTVSYGNAYGFSTDIPSPTLSTLAGATDVLGFQYSANAGKWRLLGIVKGF